MTDLLVANEVDFKSIESEHSSPYYTIVTQNNGGDTVALTTTGGNQSVFDIPAEVFNGGRSIFEYIMTPGASIATNTNVLFADKPAEIKGLKLTTRSGFELFNQPNFNKYLDTVARFETKLEKVMTNDYAGNGAGAWNGLHSCDYGANATGLIPEQPTVDQPRSYCASKYVIGAGAGATPVIRRSFYLDSFLNTVIGLNRVQYFGQTLQMTVTWASTTQIYYQAVTANIATTVASNAPGVAGAVISDMKIRLCIEKNPIIVETLKRMYESGQLSYNVPVVKESMLNMPQSTKQTLNLTFSGGDGERLLRLYAKPYNVTEANDTAFDGHNVGGAKVVSCYSTINSIRQTENDLLTANHDQYNLIKRKLQGSCITGSLDYLNNYAYIEDFTDQNPLCDKPVNVDLNSVKDGLSTVPEVKWSLYNTTSNTSYNWYVYAIFQRRLVVSPQGIAYAPYNG